MTMAPIEIHTDVATLAQMLARRLLGEIALARKEERLYLLGCPGGRTPKPVYQAMAALLWESPQDLRHVVIVMMDEYLVGREGDLPALPDENAHFSCRAFGRHEILDELNAPLPLDWGIPEQNLWLPDPSDPAAYDERINCVGGIDHFLLASGASDGHVAFNPAGSAFDTKTRIIRLSETTRRDNMQTFPAFTRLEQVPQFGVSVGIATIARQSKAATMLLWGRDKRLAYQRICQSHGYEPQWPASVIHCCPNAMILADAAVSKSGDD